MSHHTPGQPSAAAARDAMLSHVSPAGRDQFRRLRRTETDAYVTAHRLEVIRLLGSIGTYQIGLAELAREQAVATRPALAGCAQTVVECVAAAVRSEIEEFVARGAEARR